MSDELQRVGISWFRYITVNELREMEHPVIIQTIQRASVAVLVPYELYLQMQKAYFEGVKVNERIAALHRNT